MDKKQFGKLLITLRERNHISQKRLAELLFVSPPAVCKWEKGENLPSRELRIRIAEIFSVSTDDIEYPDYLLKKMSMDSDEFDELNPLSPDSVASSHDNGSIVTANPFEPTHTSDYANVSLAEFPTEKPENKYDEVLPVAFKPTISNHTNRKGKQIILCIAALVILVVGVALYISRISAHNGIHIIDSFERYINDPVWGDLYETVYIVDDLPDYEWMASFGNERLPYLLEADLGVDIVRFSYYKDINEVSENVNDTGVYYYCFLNVIIGN